MTTQEYNAFETYVKNLKHIVTRNQNYEFAAITNYARGPLNL